MPPPVGLVNLSAGDLVSSAGGDPWQVNDELQAGDSASINAQADAFHAAAGSTTEVEGDFTAAKKRFEEGWRHNGVEHPINDSPEVKRATQTLHLQKSQLAKIALDLENVAAALATAQRTSDGQIAALDNFLHGADDAIGAAKAANKDTSALHDAAVSTTRITLREVQKNRDAYASRLAAAEVDMASLTNEALPGASESPGGEKGEEPFSLKPTGSDLANAGAAAIAGGTADGVRQAATKAIDQGPKTGPGAADPGLLKWLENPEVGGFELKGFTRMGGVVAAAAAVPAAMSDIHDGNSVPEAVTRETVATAAGIGLGAIAGDAAAGALAGSVVPGVGTAVGLVTGAVVGAGGAFVASKGVEAIWDPIADAVGSLFGS